MARDDDTLTVAQTADALDVSLSTVWRLLRAGSLKSTTRSGRRLVYRREVERRTRTSAAKPAPVNASHPFLRMLGAFRSGGRGPGSENKRAVLSAE